VAVELNQIEERRIVFMVGIEAVTVPTGSKPVYVVEIQQPRLTDESRLDEIREQILAIDKDATGVDILIDLSPVEFLSSAALGMLGMIHRKTWAAKGRLKLCGIRPEVLQVFQVTKLDSLFDIHDDRRQGLASF